MKFSLLLLSLLLASALQAKKERTLELEILDIYSMEKIDGVSVQISNDTNSHKNTDKNGVVQFREIPTSVELVNITITPINHEKIKLSYHIGKKGVFKYKVYLYPLDNYKNSISLREDKLYNNDSINRVSENEGQSFCSEEFDSQHSERYRAIVKKCALSLRYPLISVENENQGKVLLRFIIEPDGSFTNILVVEKVTMELDREAIRTLQAVGRTVALKCNQKQVRVECTIPIVFSID